MVPSSTAEDNADKLSFPELAYPSLRDGGLKDAAQWLQGKALDDGAEGLWRIHDKLYDFQSFVSKHPGGQDWLILTKGTDITEAFESHHISSFPERMLSTFYMREAKTKRNSPFTFKEDGFYRTLKGRVRTELSKIPKDLENKSKRFIEFLLLGTFIFSILICNYNSALVKFVFSSMAGLFLAWTTICAHNFFHQKDNWRMYLFNLGFMTAREWRVTHALSHHLFPNTLMDYEISSAEPWFQYMVKSSKSIITRFAPWAYSVVVYILMADVQLAKRIVRLFEKNGLSTFHLEDLIPVILPMAMYALGGSSLAETLLWWLIVVHTGSFVFGVVGYNAAHHHPEIFHDGDEPCPDTDWGVHQLDAVMDRVEIKGSLFRVLTNFGDHSLHHLFPTLDHARLESLYPLVSEVCQEFSTSVRTTTQWELVKGQYQQLARVEPREKLREKKNK